MFLSSRSLKQATLAGAGECFKIVMFHHPPYNSGSRHATEQLGLDLRANLTPLFDRHGVDLVLNGHEHDYERSYPVRAGAVVARSQDPVYADPGGTIYLVTGGGGAPLYANGASWWTATSSSVHNCLVLDRNGDRWDIEARTVDGSPTGAVFDRMSLAKAACAPGVEAAQHQGGRHGPKYRHHTQCCAETTKNERHDGLAAIDECGA